MTKVQHGYSLSSGWVKEDMVTPIYSNYKTFRAS
jgi:hypothetical protein